MQYNTAEIEQQITERKNMERAERIRDAIFGKFSSPHLMTSILPLLAFLFLI